MITDELVRYIKQERARGASDDQIRNTLKSQGWQDADIAIGLGPQPGGQKKSTVATVVTIILFFLFWPLALVLMWVWTDWSRNVKIALSAVFGVFIIVIGVVVFVVLRSLGEARGKARDAAIKGNLANVRVQAEIYYDRKGSYGSPTYLPGDCVDAPANSIFGDPGIVQSLSAVRSYGAGELTCAISETDQTWAISARLPSDAGEYWCVDSTGSSLVILSPIRDMSCL